MGEQEAENINVFIGSLSWGTDEDMLTTFLKDHGLTPIEVRIIRNNQDNRSRGFGYAEFASKEESDKCIALTGEELDGRNIRCSEDNANENPRGRGRGRGQRRGGFGGGRGGRGGGRGGENNNFDEETPTKLLRVNNISWDTDNDALYNVFTGANDARVVKFRDTGKPRGFAFVEYDTVEEAKAARESINGQYIDGRPVAIVYAIPRESFQAGFQQ